MAAIVDAGGDGLPSGVIYRVAGGLLGPADLERLRVAGVRTYVDLRGVSEDRSSIRAWATDAGVAYVSVPIEAGRTRDLLAEADHRADPLEAVYQDIVRSGGRALAAALNAAAAGPPAAIGCAAGKDRTGLVIGLLQSLVGLDEATVVRRYASDPPTVAELQPLIARHPELTDGLDDDAVRRALGTSAAAFRSAFKLVQALGGPQAYLRSSGLSKDAERTLLTRLA